PPRLTATFYTMSDNHRHYPTNTQHHVTLSPPQPDPSTQAQSIWSSGSADSCLLQVIILPVRQETISKARNRLVCHLANSSGRARTWQRDSNTLTDDRLRWQPIGDSGR